jgi:hypothetical protein
MRLSKSPSQGAERAPGSPSCTAVQRVWQLLVGAPLVLPGGRASKHGVGPVPEG